MSSPAPLSSIPLWLICRGNGGLNSCDCDLTREALDNAYESKSYKYQGQYLKYEGARCVVCIVCNHEIGFHASAAAAAALSDYRRQLLALRREQENEANKIKQEDRK